MLKQADISTARLQAKIGSRQQVIIDALSDNGAIARSRADAPDIDGLVYVENASNASVGDLVDVTITAADEHDLWAIAEQPSC